MDFFIAVAVVLLIVWVLRYGRRKRTQTDAKLYPDEFIVFDLETTGLDATKHEIIEVAALLVTREQVTAKESRVVTFQSLVKPQRKVPAKITTLTGITQEMVDQQGEELENVLRQFLDFVGNRRLVAYNAEFDIGFLQAALPAIGSTLENPVSCALKMARRAWPGRKSYKLDVLAKKVDAGQAHRALADCHRALIVYIAAAAQLKSIE